MHQFVAIFLCLLLACALGLVGMFIGCWWCVIVARGYLHSALNEAEEERYDEAKTLVLRAVRADRSLRERPELVAFYDAILQKRAKEEAPKLRIQINGWEINPFESIRTMWRSIRSR